MNRFDLPDVELPDAEWPWASEPRPLRWLGFHPLTIVAVVALAGSSAVVSARSPEARVSPVMGGDLAMAVEEALSDVVRLPDLPRAENEKVDRWVGIFTDRQRGTFERFLSRQGRFSSLIRANLRAQGMPEELFYLSMMESGLSPNAVSRARAVGLWQFMAPTAREYGLRVDSYVDERRDPVKATDAALDYLRWLHDRYDSWYLAAAAYNAGPGRVDRIVKRYAAGRTGDDDIYWAISPHLPRETREYVPKILAARQLGENWADYGFEVEDSEPYAYERVWVPGGTKLSTVARQMGIDTSVLKALNPHLIKGMTPPGETFELRVPEGESGTLVASYVRNRLSRLADDD